MYVQAFIHYFQVCFLLNNTEHPYCRPVIYRLEHSLQQCGAHTDTDLLLTINMSKGTRSCLIIHGIFISQMTYSIDIRRITV